MTTLADLRAYPNKLTAKPTPDEAAQANTAQTSNPTAAGDTEGILTSKAKAEMSHIIQQNALLFVNDPAYFQTVKREFTNAIGELQVDRQWRGGIVSKEQQKLKELEKGMDMSPDGKKKKTRSIKRHTHRDIAIFKTFRIQDLRFRCRFGYVHITNEVPVGASAVTYVFSGYGGLTLKRVAEPPAKKEKKTLKNKKAGENAKEDEKSPKEEAPEPVAFDPNAYYWRIYLNEIDVTSNFEVVEDVDTNPVGFAPMMITLNGYCKVQNFNDWQNEIVLSKMA